MLWHVFTLTTMHLVPHLLRHLGWNAWVHIPQRQLETNFDPRRKHRWGRSLIQRLPTSPDITTHDHMRQNRQGTCESAALNEAAAWCATQRVFVTKRTGIVIAATKERYLFTVQKRLGTHAIRTVATTQDVPTTEDEG